MKLWDFLGFSPSELLKNPHLSVTLRFRKTWGETKPMNNWKWFDPTKEPNLVGVDPETISKLDAAREKTLEEDPEQKGVPFIVTCGRRSADKNMTLKGSVKDSSHLPHPPEDPDGLARGVDLHCDGTSRSFCLMLVGLILAGFRRIGIYYREEGALRIPTHLHVDDDPLLPPKVAWIKQEEN